MTTPHSRTRFWILALAAATTCLALSSVPSLAQQTTQAETEPNRPDDANSSSEADEIPAPDPEMIRGAMVRTNDRRRADLAADAGSIWLNDTDGPFLAIWRPQTAGKAAGALLIVTDLGEDPLSAPYLHDLRAQLPDKGWAILSLALPPPIQTAIPPRPAPIVNNSDASGSENPEQVETGSSASGPEQKQTSEENSSSAASASETEALPVETGATRTETIEARNEQIQKRITAGLEYLSQQGQYNVVIMGKGLSAPHVQSFLRGMPKNAKRSMTKGSAKAVIDRPVNATILYNAAAKGAGEDLHTAELLTTPEIPTLDLFVDDFASEAARARERSTATRASKYQDYVQIRLASPGYASSRAPTPLTRAIYGFIETRAKGKEL